MAPGHHALRRALAPVLVCCAFALINFNAATARAQQAEPPRRPQGPAAGPVIRLPRGAGAPAEQTQPDAVAKDAAARAASAPTKWEYCAIVGFSYHQRGLGVSAPALPSAIIRYFPNTTEEVDGSNEEDAIANAFVKLGDDGWELAGVRTAIRLTDGSGGSSTAYFFKRPK